MKRRTPLLSSGVRVGIKGHIKDARVIASVASEESDEYQAGRTSELSIFHGNGSSIILGLEHQRNCNS